MENFPRNFRDNLRITGRTMLIAGLIIAAFFIALVLAYSAFGLGAVLPRRPP